VVILSPGGRFLSELMPVLARRRSPVDALVVYAPSRRPTSSGRRRGVPDFLRRLAGWVRRRLYVPPAGAAVRVIHTGALNGTRMTRRLRGLRPDVVVLAHCGLLDPHVLECAREGVVNVHPGLLPWIRGSSPLGNSLQRGVPLGCTAFRVDAGIDTGRVLHRRLVPVLGGETAGQLRDNLFSLWVEMTADLVAAARNGVDEGFRQDARFALCRTLSRADAQRAIDAAVRDGVPRTAFEAWSDACDTPDLSLPWTAAVRPLSGSVD
jgi:hypothetical protein